VGRAGGQAQGVLAGARQEQPEPLVVPEEREALDVLDGERDAADVGTDLLGGDDLGDQHVRVDRRRRGTGTHVGKVRRTSPGWPESASKARRTLERA
jgi:hypothetical protein